MAFPLFLEDNKGDGGNGNGNVWFLFLGAKPLMGEGPRFSKIPISTLFLNPHPALFVAGENLVRDADHVRS